MRIHFLILFIAEVLPFPMSILNLPSNSPIEIHLDPVDSVQLTLQDIPSNVTHLTIQVHTQWQNLTLSQAVPIDLSNTVSGNHVGLVMLMNQGQRLATWDLSVNTTHNSSIIASALVTLLGSSDAIPGGCNLELPLEDDPNVYSPLFKHQNHVVFALPNMGPPRRGSVPKCGSPQVMGKLRLELYIMWLPERDLSWATYNESLHKMLSAESMLKYGTKVKDISYHHAKTAVRFAAYPNQGVVYNVLAYENDTGITQVAHVPMVTYSCQLEECSSYNVIGMVIVHILAVLGIFLCYSGHRWFLLEITLFGGLAFQLLGFILLARFSQFNETECVWLSLVPAVVGGGIWLAFWLCVGMPVLSVLLPGLVMGFLVSSVLFSYTPFGSFIWWESGFNYGMAFLCGVLLPAVILLVVPRALSIVACSVVGSYLALLAVDMWLKGSLRLLLINSIHKATVADFLTAEVIVPYQLTDIILISLWLCMVFGGITIQFVREQGRPDFPPHPWLKLRRQEAADRRRVLMAVNRPTRHTYDDERQPLLREPVVPNHNTEDTPTSFLP